MGDGPGSAMGLGRWVMGLGRWRAWDDGRWSWVTRRCLCPAPVDRRPWPIDQRPWPIDQPIGFGRWRGGMPSAGNVTRV